MGYDWTHRVIHDSRATLGDRLVLFVLAECADNETGTCYPSVKSIANRSVLSERAVQYSLRRLVDMGMISVIQNGSKFGTNLYNLTPMMGGAKFAPGGELECTGGVNPIAPEPSVKPSEKKETRAKEIPKDWTPTQEGAAYCKERNLPLSNTVEKFVDHHRSKGNTFKDIDAAFRNWCRNAVEFNKSRQPDQPKVHTGGKMTAEELIGFEP